MEMHAFRMNNVGLGGIKNSAISVPQLVTDGARESVRVFESYCFIYGVIGSSIILSAAGRNQPANY